MQVEVVYALQAEQFVLALTLDEGATVTDALEQAAAEAPFCDLDLGAMPIGVHGELVPRETRLRDGDRVEIYRPLSVDPMEARRRRASHK
jgi:putative ubiquitin-RnfH superfamily antitoxin RatB of RatAB toxin-antitoxin module